MTTEERVAGPGPSLTVRRIHSPIGSGKRARDHSMRLAIVVTFLALGWPTFIAAQSDSGVRSGAKDAGSNADKFIVLGCHEVQASAWEYAPGSNELIKRYDFPQCRWTPRRLATGLPQTFLSVKILDEQGWHWEQRLLDFWRWTAKRTKVERRFDVIGRIKNDYYLHTHDGRFLLLSATTGDVRAVAKPGWRLLRLGPWRLMTDSEGKHILFAPDTGRVVQDSRAPISLRSLAFRHGKHPAVSPDGRYLAWLTGPDWTMMHGSQDWKSLPLVTSRLPSNVMVYDLETGETRSAPVGFFGIWSSGGWAEVHRIGLRFLADGRVSFLSVVEGAEWSGQLQGAIDRGEVEHVTMRLADGDVTRRRATLKDRGEPDPIRGNNRENALSYLARIQRVGAFLKRHSVVTDGKRTMPRSAAFSHDERHFFAWVPTIGFFFGDFERDRVRAVKAVDVKDPRVLLVRANG